MYLKHASHLLSGSLQNQKDFSWVYSKARTFVQISWD